MFSINQNNMAALIRQFSTSGFFFPWRQELGTCFSRIRVLVRHGSSVSPMNMLELGKRGLVENVFPDTRNEELLKLFSSHQALYCGFDPTADSLHIGNLISIITLIHGQRAGHSPIVVVGGATALIGDPSGKSKDREPMKAEDVENNVISLMENVERVFNNHSQYFNKDKEKLPPLRIFNNQDWYKGKDVITFLSSVGRHFRLGEMISRQSVQSRLNSREGISCTEFMYQVFQASDWLHLFQHFKCAIQVGGKDQMGNISSGFNLIHKSTQEYVFGLLVPLLLSPSGEKLGKSTGNSMWLNPSRTSPFDLYQYFFNLPDSAVEHYLKLLTFLSLDEIESLMTLQRRIPEKRHGQRKLAEQVTLLVHGELGLDSAEKCTEVLFGDTAAYLPQLKLSDLQQLFKNATTFEMVRDPKMTVLDLCQRIKCFSRDIDADRIIKAGGVYINQERVTQPELVLRDGAHLLPIGVTLVRVGKKNYTVVKWLD